MRLFTMNRATIKNERQIKAAKPEDKPYRLQAAVGLFLEVMPLSTKKQLKVCTKRWRFRYFFGGKEKMLSLGLYPDVSLLEAKEMRDECRKQIKQGIDPSQKRKSEKEARKWLEATHLSNNC